MTSVLVRKSNHLKCAFSSSTFSIERAPYQIHPPSAAVRCLFLKSSDLGPPLFLLLRCVCTETITYLPLFSAAAL